MTLTGPTLALAGLLALGGPAYGGTRPAAPAPDTVRGPGAAVPYVAQGPLLCGGASAAMVERFWGALGVYADAYAPLVVDSAGGIFTDDLARAMERRGFRVRVLRGRPDAALEEVRRGVPVIALLEGGGSRYHYVVVVAAGPDEVRYHDPLKAPGRTVDRTTFLRRWAASDAWALVGVPDPTAARDTAEPVDASDTAAGTPAGAPIPAGLEAAMAALREGRTDTAVARAQRWLRDAPGDADPSLALEILAAARYLAGRPDDALRTWNRVGVPAVDLVRVQGLEAMRWRVVVDPLGIEPGDVLTPDALRLARRRLLQLPAVAAGRVGYTPLRNGDARVEVTLVERRRGPWSVAELVGLGLGAAVNQGTGVEVGPFLGVGERWRLTGSWEEAKPMAAAEVAVPWRPLAAVATVGGGWTEERFTSGAATRTWGLATVRRWLTPGVRGGMTLGLERWDGGSRIGRVGLSALLSPGDIVQVGAAVDGWAGAGRGAARARAAARVVRELTSPPPAGSLLATGRVWALTVGGSLASAGAPATIWDGAGTGRIRAPLLRGHPLVRDGRIGAGAFGRGLAHGSVAHRWFLEAGPSRAAIAVFVDAARVWEPLDGTGPRGYVDPGLELRLTADGRTAAVSLARGDGWVLSVRAETGELPWLSRSGG